MKYIEVNIFTSVQGIEYVTAMLMEHGIVDAAVEDPGDLNDLLNKKNEYDWDYIDDSVMALSEAEPKVTFYIEDMEASREKVQQIKIAAMMLKSRELEGRLGEGVSLGRLYTEDRVVDDQDWKDNWKEYFKPAKLTERLVVKPSWEQYEKQQGELVIELDPGMAFGTGTHPTTTLCLRLLEKHWSEGKSVLDVGCGSGILAIAAGLLGAQQVLGVEIDPAAVEIGRQNVALNGLSDRVKVVEGDLTKGIDFTADIVVANIMADVVKILSKDVAKHMKPGGVYISSGILIEKQQEVVSEIQCCGFEVLEIAEEGEWCSIAAKVI